MSRNSAFLFCLLVVPFLAAQDATIEFPNGAHRTWLLANGNEVEATLKMSIRNPAESDPARRYSFYLESGNHRESIEPFSPRTYANRGLGPRDKAWIRDAVYQQEHAERAGTPLDPAHYVDPGLELDRNRVGHAMADALRGADPYLAAIARFVVWWNLEEYLTLSNSDDANEIVQDFLRTFDRHFTDRRDKYRNFPRLVEEFRDFLEGEYRVPVLASAKEELFCSPERLAHYCRGRNATILGVTTYEKGRRLYTWRLALLEASADGAVTLEWHGEQVHGRLRPIDPDDDWKDMPAKGAWEIEILNRRSLLNVSAITEEIRVVIDPAWGNSLWVLRPYILTDKKFLTVDAPPLMPLPIASEQGPEAGMVDKVISAMAGVGGGDFRLREEWNPPHLTWKAAFQPAARTWTRTDGKTVGGVFRGLISPGDWAVSIDSGGQTAPVLFSDLVPADQTYAVFASAEQHPTLVDKGRFLYEMRRSRDEALLLELRFEDGFAAASWKDAAESDGPKGASLLGRARKLINGPEDMVRIDYRGLQYSGSAGFGGTMKAEDFSTERIWRDEEVLRPYALSRQAVHEGLPCRVMEFDPRGDRFGGALFTRQAKISRLGPPEASLFWRYLILHPDFSSDLQPFSKLIHELAILGLVPVDLVYQGKGDLARAYRIRLLEMEVERLGKATGPPRRAP